MARALNQALRLPSATESFGLFLHFSSCFNSNISLFGPFLYLHTTAMFNCHHFFLLFFFCFSLLTQFLNVMSGVKLKEQIQVGNKRSEKVPNVRSEIKARQIKAAQISDHLFYVTTRVS